MRDKKIILIRHGETPWSITGQHTGLTDISLTENGKKQAAAILPLLPLSQLKHVFVSPLKRAKETFDLLKLQIPFTLDGDLKEWNYGDYEGLTSAEIHSKRPEWNLFTEGVPGGESFLDVQTRAKNMLQKALLIEGDVAFVSSGHILRTIATVWLGQDIVFGRRLMLFPASISILSYEHKEPSILLWNKTAYPS
jgi:broad specificity phosphatase PhoE